MFDYVQYHFQIFLIVFMRIFGLFLVMPIISTNIPAMSKAGFAFFVALLSMPLVLSFKTILLDKSIILFSLNLLNNLLIGLSIGTMIYTVVTAIYMASNIFSTTMGLNFSENVSPLTHENSPVIGNFLSVLVLLLFIRTESHIIFIEVIIDSFKTLPYIQELATKNILLTLKTLSSMLFILGFRIAFPIIAITLLLDVGIGMISRVAPQFNVMIMGWNIKILLSFLTLWIILPLIIDIGSATFQELYRSIQHFLAIS